MYSWHVEKTSTMYFQRTVKLRKDSDNFIQIPRSPWFSLSHYAKVKNADFKVRGFMADGYEKSTMSTRSAVFTWPTFQAVLEDLLLKFCIYPETITFKIAIKPKQSIFSH